jgi:hypothetical protein
MALRKKTAAPQRHGRKAAASRAKARRKEPVDQIVADGLKIVRELAAMPTLHDADPDEWLYDERGLPH